MPHKQNPSTSVSAAELRHCAEVLNALVEDRGLLTQLSKEERKALMTAAGRVSRPNRDEARRLRRTLKRFTNISRAAPTVKANTFTGIRTARD